MSYQNKSFGGPVETMNSKCRALRLQMPLGPAYDCAVIAPLRTLRSLVIGFVPDRVVADVRDQGQFRRNLGQDFGIVVKV